MLPLSDNKKADVIDLKHLSLFQDIEMTCLILPLLILNKWQVRYIPLN